MTGDVKKGNIIVIDDDDMVNEVLSFILKEEYDVLTFFNAEDALNNGQISTADAIITDVNLPGMNGIDFLRQVYQVDSNIPVIVITAYNDIDIAIFQNSKESYLPLALKYRRLTRSVSKQIPIDIIPVGNNNSDSIFLKEIESGELIYER